MISEWMVFTRSPKRGQGRFEPLAIREMQFCNKRDSNEFFFYIIVSFFTKMRETALSITSFADMKISSALDGL